MSNKNGFTLITGGSGEVGVALIKRLKARGERLILTTSSQNGERKLSKLTSKEDKIFMIDLTQAQGEEYSILKDFVANEKINEIYHLVGGYNDSSVANYSFSRLENLIKLNLLSTANIVELTKDNLVMSKGRFVYISSFYSERVSGKNTAYAVSKLSAEVYLRGFNSYLRTPDRNSDSQVEIYRVKSIDNAEYLSEAVLKRSGSFMTEVVNELESKI